MEGAPTTGQRPRGCLLLFTKPAIPGRVKTRLIGPLRAEQAASLHAAFLADLELRMAGSPGFALRLAWALEAGEEMPARSLPGIRQRGADLGERLYHALAEVLAELPWAAAIGSDHPRLPLARVEEAFAALAAGAPVVLGPAADGGYYLVGVRREALSPRLFAEIPWSGPRVLATTLRRCAELGLEAHQLAPAADVDTPEDLAQLAAALAADGGSDCPCTTQLLASWALAGIAEREPGPWPAAPPRSS